MFSQIAVFYSGGSSSTWQKSGNSRTQNRPVERFLVSMLPLRFHFSRTQVFHAQCKIRKHRQMQPTHKNAERIKDKTHTKSTQMARMKQSKKILSTSTRNNARSSLSAQNFHQEDTNSSVVFSFQSGACSQKYGLRPVHLRACALKPFSLHFLNPSFGLTNLDGRLLRLPVDTVTILTLDHLGRRKYS